MGAVLVLLLFASGVLLGWFAGVAHTADGELEDVRHSLGLTQALVRHMSAEMVANELLEPQAMELAVSIDDRREGAR